MKIRYNYILNGESNRYELLVYGFKKHSLLWDRIDTERKTDGCMDGTADWHRWGDVAR